MKCPKCGTNNQEGSNHCIRCGTPFSKTSRSYIAVAVIVAFVTIAVLVVLLIVLSLKSRKDKEIIIYDKQVENVIQQTVITVPDYANYVYVAEHLKKYGVGDQSVSLLKHEINQFKLKYELPDNKIFYLVFMNNSPGIIYSASGTDFVQHLMKFPVVNDNGKLKADEDELDIFLAECLGVAVQSDTVLSHDNDAEIPQK